MQKTHSKRIIKSLPLLFLLGGGIYILSSHIKLPTQYTISPNYQIEPLNLNNPDNVEEVLALIEQNKKTLKIDKKRCQEEDYLKNKQTLVIKTDDKTVGFSTFVLKGNENIKQTNSWIWLMAIDQKHQSQGCGTALMRATLQKLKTANKDNVGLFVKADNRVAQSFYKKIGFKQWGKLTCPNSNYLLIMSYNID